MKRIMYAVWMVLLLSTACQKNWNAHYNEEQQNASPLNLLEYLKSKSQYSEFVSKLEEFGLAEELERDQSLTVWAVSNEGMAALSSMEEDTKFILSYHINSLSYDQTKLKSGLRVMTFNGKYLSIDKFGEQITVGDAQVQNGNQLCKNGVVHEIDQILIPDRSIYEYIEELGDDYSLIRDTLLAMNDTIFDLENSIPTGVDPTGNTVYDSLFVITNPIFDRVNFRSEFANVTMFMPSNQVITSCFDDLAELYDQFGKEFLRNDTLKAYAWIKDAIFYNELIESSFEDDIVSAFGKLWKPSVQLIDHDYKRMSNGRIYDITKLKIPNYEHIDMIKQLFHYWEFVPDAEKDALFTLNNVTNIQLNDDLTVEFPTLGIEVTYRTLHIHGDLDDGLPASIEFTPIMLEQKPDGSTGYKIVEVPPGEYNLYLGFRASSHPFVNVYVDDVPVAEMLNVEPATPWNYDRATNTVPGTRYNGWGGLVGPIMIDGDAVRSFKLTLEFAGLGKSSVERMIPYHWTLVPTENNY